MVGKYPKGNYKNAQKFHFFNYDRCIYFYDASGHDEFDGMLYEK